MQAPVSVAVPVVSGQAHPSVVETVRMLAWASGAIPALRAPVHPLEGVTV
jgi:hypothetical protein